MYRARFDGAEAAVAADRLARGGAFVLTDEVLDPGSRLIIELELPNGPTIQRIAHAVWNRISIPSGNLTLTMNANETLRAELTHLLDAQIAA